MSDEHVHTSTDYEQRTWAAQHAPPPRWVSGEIERILTDLIAELRDGKECYLSGECCDVDGALNRAEQRLREVTGDE